MNPAVRETEALTVMEPDFLEVLEEWDREELPFILVNGYIPEAQRGICGPKLSAWMPRQP